MPDVRIGERVIGAEQPPYVIAEAGVNHNGDPDLALRLVEAAFEAGADAVKFQTFEPDALATPDAASAPYQVERTGQTSQLEMLRGLVLSESALGAVAERAAAIGITFLSTPFDERSVGLLVSLAVPALKVGSGDLTNPFLLRAVAATGLPLLLSTGMATLDEIDAAVGIVRESGERPLVLLQCTSAYPAPADQANLRAIATLAARYDVPAGLSDHSTGIAVAIAATALGAAVIEKHLTLDRTLPGPDHAASLEPDEMAAMVAGVRIAHAALGDGRKAPMPSELEGRYAARRSLVTAHAVPAGQRLTAEDLAARRPESGIGALRLGEVIGRVARRDLPAHALLQPGDVDPPLDS